MARIRSIHPSLWTDENFVSLTMASRLFLIGLWGEADDYGIFEWKPVGLKMRIMPADAVDAAALLAECERSGFLVRIERNGKPYGVVRNFRKFQRPKNPSEPSIAVDVEISDVIKLSSTDRNYPGIPQPCPRPTENHPQMEDVGCRVEDVERTDADASDANASAPALVVNDGWPADFKAQFWEAYPHRVGKTDALAKLDRIRKSKRVTFDKLMSGLSAYIRSKPPDRQWCNPATWLNQGRWDDEPSTDIQRNTAGQHELLGAFDRLAEHAQRMEDAGPPPGGWGA